MLLAIDPGTQRAGFAMMKKAGTTVTVECCWVVRFMRSQSKHMRLAVLKEQVQKAVQDFNPEWFAVESGYVGPNPKGALVIAEARGVIIASIPNPERIIEVDPSTAKLMATGKGNASKALVRQMIKAQLGLRQLPDEDAADACAVGLAALTRRWAYA